VDFRASRREASPPAYDDEAESVIERSSMVKGYEFERGKFVLFTSEELKALEAGSRQTIDIVSFIPEKAVDPIYYSKAYLLAPDKRGAKPYSLLLRAMRDTGRCAIAKWAFRSKEYVAQIRAADDGMILQQLFYADEVRSLASLHIEMIDVGAAELNLAKKLIEQLFAASYDPTEFVDEEKQRILAAVEEKIAGKNIAALKQPSPTGGQVVDLLKALQASLEAKSGVGGTASGTKPPLTQRKPSKRAARKPPLVPAAPSKERSGKK
jgi:DNA end-binding protein Ku